MTAPTRPDETGKVRPTFSYTRFETIGAMRTLQNSEILR
jgi:hypothetical protein